VVRVDERRWIARPAQVRTMRTLHATFTDALTGSRLDATRQCVPVAIAPVTNHFYSHDAIGDVGDVGALATWLQKVHAARCRDGTAPTRSCVLITAGPAMGKTCLMSQLITHVLKEEKAALVPILIKVTPLRCPRSQAIARCTP
jgi:hypothetical protein